jgi:pilus assembly protein CpaE
MPVLVEGDTGRARTLAAALPPGAQIVSAPEQVENWLANRADEYVVVLGPEVDMTAATGLAHRMRQTHPSTGVVLLRPELSTEAFTTAMGAGISSVVAEDDATGLSAAVDRSRQTWEAIHGPSRSADSHDGAVVTVFSPKGGVGKTTIAVNLGLALADRGAKRVCILDLDLAFGDVAITLQLIPDHTISEAVEVEAHLDFSLLETLLTRHEQGLMILAAPTSPDGKDRIPASLVRKVIQILRRNFDYVVIDTSPGFDDQVLQAFDETDEILLVATLDVPTVKNVKMAIETLDTLGLVKEHRHLVLNRADDEVGLSTGQVEGILKMKVVSTMPTSLAVANATNHGRPIVLAKPDHPVSTSIQALSRRLAGVAAHAPADAVAAKRGLFGRKK